MIERTIMGDGRQLSVHFFDNLQARAKAAGAHLLASCLIAGGIAALVFLLWYPGDYSNLAGGMELFLLVMTVDVVLGPLLTFAVFNRKKGMAHLRRDIAIIVLLQMSALAYGVHTVFIARPVALVFEFDRFRVISSADVLESELPQALPEFRRLPLNGPEIVALRRPEDGDEKSNALASAIFDGVDTGQRPKFWIPYSATARAMAVAKARPLEDLVQKYPEAAHDVSVLTKQKKADGASLSFLPVLAKNDAVAVLREDGSLVAFLPYDGFF
jgi:hypothetical protein